MMQQPRRSSAQHIALGLSVAALLVAIAPLAALVAVAKPVLEASSRSHALASSLLVGGKMALPSKFATKYALPQYYQEDRGTCWDFATIGFLEQRYRQHGVEKGWLHPMSYVRFSEQAFGISMIEACQGHPDVCDVVGDLVMQNNTDGGEPWWMYSLTTLYDEVLPTAVCPYTTQEHMYECPAMRDALATNPIKFSIPAMETAYSVRDIKELMVKYDSPLVWSSFVHGVSYYFPCDDVFWGAQQGCSATARVRCPTDRFYNSEYCARFESAMFTMDGEFFMHGNTVLEGGHGMNAVAFNDEFTTKQGHRGGFVIKNSWHDKTYGTDPNGRGARGSHSIAYWMQQISAWQEKVLCPGALNPDNWISCVSQAPGPTMQHSRFRSAPVTGALAEPKDLSKTCLSPEFMTHMMEITLQPSEFQCIDTKWCSNETHYRYFLDSAERNAEQDLLKVCMLRLNTESGEQYSICTPYVNPSLVAYIWAPIPEQLERLKQDEDFCGYYFWPYETAYKQAGMYLNLMATYFHIEWDDSSYLENRDKYPDRDYSYLVQSTNAQMPLPFGAVPSPFPKQRY